MIDFTEGAARELIAPEHVETLRAAGALIEDVRRERPRYFDGRFLAARDLIRDQQYFLAREADLGQTAGGGVTAGLNVTRGTAADELLVSRGHGVTPAGELTLLPQTLSVHLAEIPVAEQLSARFSLSRLPQPALRSRTGLFVLALRPVEFTANPIGAYPTSITGPRTVEDGDVIEATAVVLVPWTNDNATDALDARRGRAARTIFVENRPSGDSANVLPLAMLALQNNIVVWLDVAMVRRELGADHADRPGLGVGGRALRLAHILQYHHQLEDELSNNGGRGFPAVSRFDALPPAGPMPPGMIATRDFTQNYFPAEIDAELAPIPDDELAVVIEESLALPPIDLTMPPALLDSTAVLVLAPVPRTQWGAVNQRLQPTGTTPATRQLLPAAANRLAARKPLEILQRLRLPVPVPLPRDTSDPVEIEWARLAALPNLWFVRRRNLAYRDDLPGRFVRFAGRESPGAPQPPPPITTRPVVPTPVIPPTTPAAPIRPTPATPVATPPSVTPTPAAPQPTPTAPTPPVTTGPIPTRPGAPITPTPTPPVAPTPPVTAPITPTPTPPVGPAPPVTAPVTPTPPVTAPVTPTPTPPVAPTPPVTAPVTPTPTAPVTTRPTAPTPTVTAPAAPTPTVTAPTRPIVTAPVTGPTAPTPVDTRVRLTTPIGAPSAAAPHEAPAPKKRAAPKRARGAKKKKQTSKRKRSRR